MTKQVRIGAAILAAGASRRFGDADKLTTALNGRMLGQHVAYLLADLDFAERWIVTASQTHPCREAWEAAKFAIAVNECADTGMGSSVAIAAHLAQQARCDFLLIALADMPLVPAGHFIDVIAKAVALGQTAIAASTDGDARMPPAVFGSHHFDELARSTGDEGARDLLQQAATVECSGTCLLDIDNERDLAIARKSLGRD
ncbi:nucleotidyltransferase family protein [Croceicoccus naphthovorans]|uniref:MobA-like NTP transferase domain-containing protein n=1 Tax=Croceicoccus naphthovorans TaxID=1348774 RepID=A0A0G3XEJ5_9SPHN|nr:NTP transferase domain-containing protein [Croceicoccus naphthovorans]AKM09602.1 hypothetical protein AB433_05795 [Croceicoccus naphthovorans]MBB3989626.1 CTP:molybdopterin cytidylyltransferase MocA [Croceicoccus naphthovorans]